MDFDLIWRHFSLEKFDFGQNRAFFCIFNCFVGILDNKITFAALQIDYKYRNFQQQKPIFELLLLIFN